MIQIFKAILLLSFFLCISCADHQTDAPAQPGIQDDGSILLNTGLSVTPAGKSLEIDGKPVLASISPDDRYIAVYSETGNEYVLAVIDLNRLEPVSEYQLDSRFTGMCFDPSGTWVYASCGNEDIVRIYSFSDGKLEQERTLNPGYDTGKKYFPTGIAVSQDGKYLVTANLYSGNVSVYRTDDWDDLSFISTGEHPFSVTFYPDNRHIIVGSGENGSLNIINLEDNKISGSFVHNEILSSLIITPDGGKIYAAEPYKDRIAVIDLNSGDETGSIDISLVNKAPSGTIPWFLSASSDGRALYCANAGNNCIAVIDISSSKGTIKGLIPTNRFPVYVNIADNRLVTAGIKDENSGYISVIEIPDEAQLSEFTEQVNANNKFAEVEENLNYGIGVKYPRAVPEKIGEPSLIKYVFYIIKGNASYDRILGNTSVEDNTPNYHALAGEFTLLENFYSCGRSNTDGILWNTAGISIDFYNNLKPFAFITGQPADLSDRFDHAGISQIKYLWNEAENKGIAFTLLGINENSADNKQGTDTERADVFIRDFQNSLEENSLAQLNVIYLPGNSTNSGQQDSPAPEEAGAADNDFALGRIIETVSNSRIWEMAAVFVIENYESDNADQDRSRRSPALIISPFVRRNYTENTMLNNLNILKTIELILGFEPLTQFDAAAGPLSSVFHENPVLTPYKSISR